MLYIPVTEKEKEEKVKAFKCLEAIKTLKVQGIIDKEEYSSLYKKIGLKYAEYLSPLR